MGRPKSNGPYAPLAATYYRDDAILEAGQDAELLFVRCLAFLADSSSDGFITERQMNVVVGMGMKRIDARVASLLEVGLLERVDGGYIVRSWLKWNKTTEEIGKHLKKDRERKAAKKGTDSAPIPRGIQTDSSDQITTSHSTTNHSTSLVAETRADVATLCTLLADLIEGNGSKRPEVTKGWLDAARLLLDKDERPLEEAVDVMKWCQWDAFWKGNVLSMPKFREKYDQLRLKRESTKPQQSTRTAQNLSVVAMFEAQERKGLSA